MNAHWRESEIHRPPKRTALAQSIADAIRRRIVTGDIPTHSRLPSVVKLASLYRVSVPTAQAAVHILRAIGFVRVSPGVGTFVNGPRVGIGALHHAWLSMTLSELAMMRCTIDQRLPIAVAQQVARSPDAPLPESLSLMSYLARERLHARHEWPEVFVRTDLRFHQAMASALTGAEVTGAVYGMVSKRMTPALIAAAKAQASDADLDRLHTALADAIVDGLPVATARIARNVAQRELRLVESIAGEVALG